MIFEKMNGGFNMFEQATDSHPSKLQDHLVFWKTFAGDWSRGITQIESLKDAKKKLTGTSLEAVVGSLIEGINQGITLSKAMALQGAVFSRSIQKMIQAGEVGGVVQVAAARIVEGLEAGCFPVPEMIEFRPPVFARFWRALGLLLITGVPLLETLNILSEEYSMTFYGKCIPAFKQTVLAGRKIADAMRECPELFRRELCDAVEAAEKQGTLDLEAFKIADALDRGELSSNYNIALEETDATTLLFETLFHRAVEEKASDIHLDPRDNGSGRIRYRIDGALYERMDIPPADFSVLIDRIKMMGGMNIHEKKLPQDGRVVLEYNGNKYDMRVALIPTVHGERAVMRVPSKRQILLGLEKMGFFEEDLAVVKNLCHLPHGMVICAGPAGCGKTTMLYSMLLEVNDQSTSVITIEDPVELAFKDMIQIDVNSQPGLTFPRTLRSILRQDPDVVMVGEIRELETAQLCVQLALSGHMVLTTLHTNTAIGAIHRLLHLGIEPYHVNGCLSGVIAIRLIRLLCPECKEQTNPPLHSLPLQVTEFIKNATSPTFYKPKGCDACHNTGYRGRTLIYEILIPDDQVRQAVFTSADSSVLRNAAFAAGMKPMLHNGLETAARGITSIEEVCRVAPFGPEE
jgi:type II secretory ATPase GspE/PulE/Tfp pilus assembly ATPase PilB-like protein